MSHVIPLEPKGVAALLRELVRHESAQGIQRELLDPFRVHGQYPFGRRRLEQPQHEPWPRARAGECGPVDALLEKSPAGRELQLVLRREVAFQLRAAAELKLAREMAADQNLYEPSTKAELDLLRARFAQTALACFSSDIETCAGAVLADCVLRPIDAWPQASELAAESLMARDCAAGRYLLGQAQLVHGTESRALKTFLGALAAVNRVRGGDRIPSLSNWAQRALESESSLEAESRRRSCFVAQSDVEVEVSSARCAHMKAWPGHAAHTGPIFDFCEGVDGIWIHLGLSAAHRAAGRGALALGSARAALLLARTAERKSAQSRQATECLEFHSDRSPGIPYLRPGCAEHCGRFAACMSCFFLAAFELQSGSALEFAAELDQLTLKSPQGVVQLRKEFERWHSKTTLSPTELRVRAQSVVANIVARNSAVRAACQSLLDRLA